MAFSIVGTPTRYAPGAGSWTSTGEMTKHTGTASGDIAIVAISYYENASDTEPSISGATFTEITGPWVLSGSGTGESRLKAWYRVMDGTTDGTGYTVSRGIGMYGVCLYGTLRGVSTLSFVSATAGTLVDPATTVSTPSVSGTATQGLVGIFGNDGGAGGADFSTPSGMSLLIEGTGDTVGVNSCALFYEDPTGFVARTSTLSQTDTAAQAIAVLIGGVNDASGAKGRMMMLGIG